VDAESDEIIFVPFSDIKLDLLRGMIFSDDGKENFGARSTFSWSILKTGVYDRGGFRIISVTRGLTKFAMDLLLA